jgi:hypothetical protein
MNTFHSRMKEASTAAAGAPDTGLFSLARLRHRCANPSCHRGKLWSRWLTPTEPLAFGGTSYCCAGCAETAFEQEIGKHLLRARFEGERPHRIPLGLLLVSRGMVTGGQLQQALRTQREQPRRRLGHLLVEQGAISEQSLLTALGNQWGCPVFPLEKNRDYLECAGLLPLALLQSTGVLPVHRGRGGRILHLAFTKRVDHTLLYAIEGMLGCQAAACVASEQAVADAVQRLHSLLPPQETVFDSVRQPQEMARMAADYAAKLQAGQVRATRAADYLWFRFENARGWHHLLFQLQAHDRHSDL